MNIPEILIVDSEDKLNNIRKFRYNVYIKELGDTYDGVDDNEGMLKDELDEFGTIMYAEDEGELIATCRINVGYHHMFDAYWDECYDLSVFPDQTKLCLASKMMIVPKWRSTLLGLTILLKAMHLTREQGGQFIFLDCIPALVPLYETIGFRRYKKNAPEDKNLKYYIPLVAVLDDAQYPKRIGSPAYSEMIKYELDKHTADWYNQQFPLTIGLMKESLIPYQELLRFVKDKIDLPNTPLLEGFDEEEVKLFLQSCMVLNCEKGETITYKGDSGREMYLLLKGELEVRDRVGERVHTLYHVKPSGVFGEMNFLLKQHRRVDAFALTDLFVLVINQSFKKLILRKHPKLANKFLENLAKNIATRKQQILIQSY